MRWPEAASRVNCPLDWPACFTKQLDVVCYLPVALFGKALSRGQSRLAAVFERISMSRYSTRKAAELVGMAPHQIRRCVRRKLLAPDRGPRGAFRFGFQDLVTLRTIKALQDANISARQVFETLDRLSQDAEQSAPASALRFVPAAGRVLIRAQAQIWDPETGQRFLDLSDVDHQDSVCPLWNGDFSADADPEGLSAEAWYRLGVELEGWDTKRAKEAYEHALARDPGHADALVNLGRLHQIKGNLPAAKRHYESAVSHEPEHQSGNYNLGTIFDELDEPELAAEYYLRAPDLANAHFNLARICQERGDEVGYRRHLQRYGELKVGEPGG